MCRQAYVRLSSLTCPYTGRAWRRCHQVSLERLTYGTALRLTCSRYFIGSKESAVRRPLIAGNWKMNLDHRQAVDLAQGVSTGAGELAGVDLAVCPPSVYLAAVAGCLDGGPVGLGGQDMYYESSGAFTGEISGAMLVDCGCQYVILGHSERRHILGETDELVHRKVVAALADGLVPILCVGELLEEREAGRPARWSIGSSAAAWPTYRPTPWGGSCWPTNRSGRSGRGRSPRRRWPRRSTPIFARGSRRTTMRAWPRASGSCTAGV